MRLLRYAAKLAWAYIKYPVYHPNSAEENIKGPIGPQMMLTFVAHSGYYFYGGDNYG
jgi:hypothetical protein